MFHCTTQPCEAAVVNRNTYKMKTIAKKKAALNPSSYKGTEQDTGTHLKELEVALTSAVHHEERLIERITTEGLIHDGINRKNQIVGNWRHYLKKMSCNGTWADHVTVQATSDMLQLPIHIITSASPESDNFDIIFCPPACKEDGTILLGHKCEDHYISLGVSAEGAAACSDNVEKPESFNKVDAYWKETTHQNIDDCVSCVRGIRLHRFHLLMLQNIPNKEQVSIMTEHFAKYVPGSKYMAGYLSDSVVMARLYILSKMANEMMGKKSSVIDIGEMRKILTGATVRMKKKTVDGDVVFMPINENNHYRLMVLDVHSKCLKYYDSLGAKLGPAVQYCDMIQNYLRMKCEVVIPQQPLQNDSNSCGVVLCALAKRILFNEDIAAPVKVNEERREITQEFLSEDYRVFVTEDNTKRSKAEVSWEEITEDEKWNDGNQEDGQATESVTSESCIIDEEHNEEIKKITLITEDQFKDLFIHMDNILKCNTACKNHTKRHKEFIKNYNMVYCLRKSRVLYGYGSAYISTPVSEQLLHQLEGKHTMLKSMTKSIFEVKTNFVCTSKQKIVMEKEAIDAPMNFAIRFIQDVLLKEAIAVLVATKHGVTIEAADNLCKQTEMLKQ
ncbi:uncharacterized protein [Ptychodera flava]|uniref:uncharacterized protein isoform X2 n=1 Tax=Ptychodera flava TaxID=63121 RepID=UPI003969CFC8